MSDLKKTALYDEHVRLGGRIVPFAGWALPVEFEGLRAEHETVRSKVGLFDVSHMGEIWFTGPKALETLQWLTTNDVSKLKAGDAQYSLLPNEKGGLVDDIIIYCIESEKEYLVCVNAANIEKDFEWMKAHNKGATIDNQSSKWSQIAVQGPKARELTARIFGENINTQAYFKFVKAKFSGQDCFIACTGYTGEDGFEIFVKNEGAVALWQEFLKKGTDLGVKPIGLGARDTLRTEMKYSLYGHEIDDSTNPIESGLSWVIKLQKGDFIGRSHMQKVKEQGAQRLLIGFKMVDKGIPREKYLLYASSGQEIGYVTSGTLSPTLNEGVGIGYVDRNFAAEGTEIFVDIRGRKAKTRVVKTPFVKPEKK